MDPAQLARRRSRPSFGGAPHRQGRGPWRPYRRPDAIAAGVDSIEQGFHPPSPPPRWLARGSSSSPLLVAATCWTDGAEGLHLRRAPETTRSRSRTAAGRRQIASDRRGGVPWTEINQAKVRPGQLGLTPIEAIRATTVAAELLGCRARPACRERCFADSSPSRRPLEGRLRLSKIAGS